ncbi:MAG TPA: TauD/TfdA family dioxygenase [Gemmataceae bacterium]|nr:TauD/TfdA family dioxygenase [Gemmataceae bacterium]
MTFFTKWGKKKPDLGVEVRLVTIESQDRGARPCRDKFTWKICDSERQRDTLAFGFEVWFLALLPERRPIVSSVMTSADLLTGPGAWRAATCPPVASSCYALPEAAWPVLDAALVPLRRGSCPVTKLLASDELRAICAPALAPALEALETGCGFAIIERVPVERLSVPEAQAIYWLVGQVLGVPFEQNVQGTLLYDVRDTGQDVQYGARFSVTNAESTFHTDNSFGTEILDYVGLLCLRTARSGGLSQMVSAVAVHNVLRERDPDALQTLYQPFHFDQRGGVRPGEAPTTVAPVFERRGDELLCRYLRYWIHTGHEKANVPLTPAQQHALDALDAVAADPALRVEFALAPGQMYFINNRWILHNRTAFDDHPEPELRRHLVRLWLKKTS